ncbi:protein phosphatase 1 regulatory subunit 12A [Stomoxys calcitrans]|uniref:protein phosphatase 1 regulatory subunit 12A n=1 Tax=Stomoxys calcitrans TaxID=35570 RepID=UPI0027E378ED|nr:protein phosphatase 1 regulatory subunit 12A [Stomoxys calcitrans]
MVNLLLANKADVNAVDKEGHSVVHWATVCGEVGALRAVLAAGANVTTPDINGGSPLHYAAQMCGASYEGKLSPMSSHKLALEILAVLLAHPQCSVDAEDKDGRQPLLWAASAGSAKAIMSLVKAGARVESADKDGLTALHCAASRGHTECLDTLISLCGAPTDLIDSNGCTALHYAVTLGHADATSRLLDFEADPNRQDRKGRTPAHCGCAKGQFETVKLLKERNANLWLRNAKGDLPLHEAASSGRRELVEWLLEQRPKQVNTTSNDGRSLLHIAAHNDYTDMCKLLIDYGADINAVYRNSKGVVITPLDCSLQKGHRSTAKFLQSHGCLPAGKLKLAARRANPFAQPSLEVVKPLQYVEKEEIHDLSNSKKYVVYLKRSESDGGEDGGSCSCAEETYRREQRYAHTCRRHQKAKVGGRQLRRRTSSCGDPKESDHDCGGMCRSKSNIEIRRRKSRERYLSSSEWEDEEDDEDSCENCCYHKRQKQKVLHKRKSVTCKRSRELEDSEGKGGGGEDGGRTTTKPSKEQETSRQKSEGSSEKVEGSEAKVPDLGSTTATTSGEIVGDTRIFSRSPSPTKPSVPTTPTATAKEGTFIKSPSPLGKESLEVSVVTSTSTAELTDEDEANENASKNILAEVQVHHGPDDEGEPAEAQKSEEATGSTATASASASEESKTQSTETEEVAKQVEEIIDKATVIVETAVAPPVTASASGEAEEEAKESSKDTENEKPQSEEAKSEEKPEETSKEEETKEVHKEEVQKAEEQKTEEANTQPAADDKAPEAQATEVSESTEKKESQSKEEEAEEKSFDTVKDMSEPTPATDNPQVPPSPSPLPNQTSETATLQDQQQPEPSAAQTNRNTTKPSETTSSKFQTTSDEVKTDSKEMQDNNVPPATTTPTDGTSIHQRNQSSPDAANAPSREQESRRSFTLLPSDSAEDEQPLQIQSEPVRRKSSFQVLKSDESVIEVDDSNSPREEVEMSDSTVFKVLTLPQNQLFEGDSNRSEDTVLKDDELEDEDEPQAVGSPDRAHFRTHEDPLSPYDYASGRKRRLKKRVKSGVKSRNNWQQQQQQQQQQRGGEMGDAADMHQSNRDQDSGFEPSPRTFKTKIPTPRNVYTAHLPRRPLYTTLDGRSCSSRQENRKAGDKGACDMTAVTRSIQRNIRRYYMERKIFQHLLELKSLQIRSNKLNEAVLVKRAVDDYHKSCAALGGETGTRLRRYNFSEYTFKNFELFLYETLKALQKPGTYNFQNINEVYDEAERRLSPDYNSYEKALQCTTRTHRCLHAAHAYTGIPCAAYIPMMNHHTMPKFGFGPYKKTGVGSFYLPKILTTGPGCGGKVSLELSHGKNKQLISLPSDKLDSNKRYFVTFTVKETEKAAGAAAASAATGNCEGKNNESCSGEGAGAH